MKKVLLIEDEKTIRDNVHDMLSMHNYEVYTATNGLEGLEIAKDKFLT